MFRKDTCPFRNRFLNEKMFMVKVNYVYILERKVFMVKVKLYIEQRYVPKLLVDELRSRTFERQVYLQVLPPLELVLRC